MNKWTKEKPREEGWYWIKISDKSHQPIQIVYISFMAGMLMSAIDNYQQYYLDLFYRIKGVEWYGPLKPPEEEEVPVRWLNLAELPIKAPRWYSSNEEEYWYTMDKDWVVLNEIIGPYRLRHIAKIVKVVKVEPEETPHE